MTKKRSLPPWPLQRPEDVKDLKEINMAKSFAKTVGLLLIVLLLCAFIFFLIVYGISMNF